MTEKAFQDLYPDDYSHCYGCGRLNEDGLHIKSFREGDESVCRFTPAHYHTGGTPGIIYGGLIASLIDCHCAGTAAYERRMLNSPDSGDAALPRFVTASLKVDFLKPTPAGVELEIRAWVIEIKERKAVLSASVTADGNVTATGEAVMVMLRPYPD